MFRIVEIKIRGEWTKDWTRLLDISVISGSLQATFSPDIAAADISELPGALGQTMAAMEPWRIPSKKWQNMTVAAKMPFATLWMNNIFRVPLQTEQMDEGRLLRSSSNTSAHRRQRTIIHQPKCCIDYRLKQTGKTEKCKNDLKMWLFHQDTCHIIATFCVSLSLSIYTYQ